MPAHRLRAKAKTPACGRSRSSCLRLILFVWSQPYVTTTITAEIEAIIHKLRVRLMDAVRRSELLSIDDIGRSRIVAAINSDSGVLTQASNTLVYSMQSVVLIFFISIYVAYLSIAALIMSVVIVGLAATVFHLRSRRLALDRARAAEQERQLFDRMDDFLDGFKEVRLNSARSVDLFDDAVEVSRAAANIKIGAQVADLPADRLSAELHVRAARRGGVRRAAVQRIVRRRIDPEGHDGAAVRCRGLFRPGAIDTDPDERECRGGPAAEISSPT